MPPPLYLLGGTVYPDTQVLNTSDPPMVTTPVHPVVRWYSGTVVHPHGITLDFDGSGML